MDLDIDRRFIASVRRSRRDRICAGCGWVISKGGQYFATQNPDAAGWLYLCLACAATQGYIAPVTGRSA